MKFKAYHKIRQFKDIVRDVSFKANFKGLNDDGEPIYEDTKKPILEFKGTVKLHGTNAGICYNPEHNLLAQKRSSFLDNSGEGHFGFNRFVKIDNNEAIKSMMNTLWLKHCKEGEQITVYGEWAGKGIQKGVAISEGDKSFFIFDCLVYNEATDEERWVDITDYRFNIDNVYNINEFMTFSMNIDFEKAGMSQNDLISYTTDVEKICPVAGQLGNVGIGEGIVWSTFWNGEKLIFKVKGEKHSTSKVKTLASVDPEVLNSINEFVDYACTSNRIEQGIKETGATEKKNIPDVLKWVANDIIEEEQHELSANNLEWKQVARDVNNRVRQHFFAKLDRV